MAGLGKAGLRADSGHRRAVITGLGLVTPFGKGVETSWQAILAGHSGVAAVGHFDATGFPCRFAAYLRDGKSSTTSDPPDDLEEPRFARFALEATRMACEASGGLGEVDPERVGIYLGTSGERLSLDRMAQIGYRARRNGGEISPSEYVRLMGIAMKGVAERFLPQYVTVLLARQFHACGPVTTVNTACTSSAHAMGEALRAVQHGRVDVAITGGSECIVSHIGFQIFSPLAVLSRRNDYPEKASRPFDAERDGFVLGEGAGFLVVEALERALGRGAPILAELAGYGTSCDAYRITDEALDGRGAILAMHRALADASLSAEKIDYINAHGTSTPMNDRIETLAIKAVFERRAYEIPVSSIKSMIGHTISAAGAIEAITCVLALRDQMVPPTINYEFPDPECDLDYVPNRARKVDLRAVLSNSFGFGGHNDCLVIRAFDA